MDNGVANAQAFFASNAPAPKPGHGSLSRGQFGHLPKPNLGGGGAGEAVGAGGEAAAEGGALAEVAEAAPLLLL